MFSQPRHHEDSVWHAGDAAQVFHEIDLASEREARPKMQRFLHGNIKIQLPLHLVKKKQHRRVKHRRRKPAHLNDACIVPVFVFIPSRGFFAVGWP